MNSLFSTPQTVKQNKHDRNNDENRKRTAKNFQFSPKVLISATATRGQIPVVGIATTPRTPLSECRTKARTSATFTPTAVNKQAAEVSATSILGKRRLPMNMVVSQLAHRGPKSPVRVLQERMVSRVKSEPLPHDPALEQLLNSIKGRQAGKLPHPRELMSVRMRKYRRMEGPEDEISKAYTSIYGEDPANKLIRLGSQRKDTESVTPARTAPHSSSYVDFVRSSNIKLYGVPDNDEPKTTPEAAVPTTDEPRWLGGDAEHEPIVSPGEILTSQSFLQAALRPKSQWSKYLDEPASLGTYYARQDNSCCYTRCLSPATPGSSPVLVRGEQNSDEAPESAQCHWLYEEEEEKPRHEVTTKKRKLEDNPSEHNPPGMVYGKMAARVSFADESPIMPRYLYRRDPESPCKERADNPIHQPSP